jgi:hypothetical protein
MDKKKTFDKIEEAEIYCDQPLPGTKCPLNQFRLCIETCAWFYRGHNYRDLKTKGYYAFPGHCGILDR